MVVNFNEYHLIFTTIISFVAADVSTHFLHLLHHCYQEYRRSH